MTYNGKEIAIRDILKMYVPEYPNLSVCWMWAGTISIYGYGEIKLEGTTHKAHRLVYIDYFGPISDEVVLHHLCANKRCVNPGHLEPSTRSEHGAMHGRPTREVCKNGHNVTGDNAYIRPDTGRLVCKECQRNNTRRYRS